MAATRWRFRRLFQFSLASALVGLTIACILLGAVVGRVERQRRAVAAIHAVGGRVTYHEEALRRSKVVVINKKAKAPAWWLKWLGQDWCDTVESVTLYGEGCNDATLRHLRDLPEVRSLALWPWAEPPSAQNPNGNARTNQPLAGITDDGIRVLSGLDKLEHISFLGNQISDQGLVHLHQHPTLTSLQLTPYDSKCTREGIDRLLGTLRPGAALH